MYLMRLSSGVFSCVRHGMPLDHQQGIVLLQQVVQIVQAASAARPSTWEQCVRSLPLFHSYR